MPFGRALTLGVEEELFLVDAESLEPVPRVTELLRAGDERLKPELFGCLVEATTGICETGEEVLAELVALRRVVTSRGEPLGVRLLASGTHPTARGAEQPVVPKPRYRAIRDELGDRLASQLVCGVHVHVGMPDGESCLRVLRALAPWLPALLALSANSPFLEGADTGLASARAGQLALLESVGEPPRLDAWADWERATAGVDYTRLWWDARPHPRLGTLEVRIADQQTEPRRSAALASVVQALAAKALDGSLPAPSDRDPYESRRRRAAAGEPVSVAELLTLLPEARSLAPGASAQREKASNGLHAVLADLATRTAISGGGE